MARPNPPGVSSTPLGRGFLFLFQTLRGAGATRSICFKRREKVARSSGGARRSGSEGERGRGEACEVWQQSPGWFQRRPDWAKRRRLGKVFGVSPRIRGVAQTGAWAAQSGHRVRPGPLLQKTCSGMRLQREQGHGLNGMEVTARSLDPASGYASA